MIELWLILGSFTFGAFVGFLTGSSRSACTNKGVAIALLGGGGS